MNQYEQLGRQLAPKAGDILGYLNGQRTPAAPERNAGQRDLLA
jgi:hypothetical protein